MVAGATPVRDTTTCLDTLRASDSVSAVVTISVRPRDQKTKLPPDFEGLLAQEIGSRLKLPRSLQLGVMVGWDQCGSGIPACKSGVLVLGNQTFATAHATGGLSRIAVIDFSLTPPLADSVRRVLERIDKEKMSPPFEGPDSIPIKISIDVQQHFDTVPSHRRLFRVNLPRYTLPFAGAEWPKDAKGPKYPGIAERNGVGDSVAVTFTVLADGSVSPESIEVRTGRYLEFMRSVFEMLAAARYVPAHIGGCAVASLEFQSFTFKMPKAR